MLEAVSRYRGFFWIRSADAGGDAWSLHAILDRLANYAWLLGTVSSKCNEVVRVGRDRRFRCLVSCGLPSYVFILLNCFSAASMIPGDSGLEMLNYLQLHWPRNLQLLT